MRPSPNLSASKLAKPFSSRLIVSDVWLAISIARAWCWAVVIVTVPIFAVLFTAAASREDLYGRVPDDWWPIVDMATRDYIIEYALFVSVGIWLLITLRLLWAYGTGIVIDLKSKTVSWPASDVEEGFLDILMGKRFVNHLHRETVGLAEITDLRNDTDVLNDRRSRLNLTGRFGSRQLEFSSKQKRDECRSQIIQAVREVGVRPTSDFNTDFG